jgi:hypothetical protein
MEFHIDLSDACVAIEMSSRFEASNSLKYPVNFYLQSASQNYITTDGQLPSLSWNKAPV